MGRNWNYVNKNIVHLVLMPAYITKKGKIGKELKNWGKK